MSGDRGSASGQMVSGKFCKLERIIYLRLFRTIQLILYGPFLVIIIIYSWF